MKIQNLFVMAVFTTLLATPFNSVCPAIHTAHTGVVDSVTQKKSEAPADELPPAESKAEDFVIDEDGTLKKYEGTASIIRIPDGVKAISASVFKASNVPLTEILEIYLPPSVEKIGWAAFADMVVKKITGGEGLKEISYGAFEQCTLGELHFPNVEIICSSAFSHATLENLDLPALKTIKSNAFSECSLTELHLPDSVSVLEDYAFAESNIKKITGIGVKEINERAFYQSALETFYFPNAETIGDEAFFRCPLKNSTELERLKTLAPNGFQARVAKPDEFVIENGILTAYMGNASILKIPEGVTEIGENTLWSCFEMAMEIYLPDSVTKISERAFPTYYEGKITGGNGVKEICRRAFRYNNVELPDFPNAEKIEAEAFYFSSVKNDEAFKRLSALFPEAFELVVSKDEDFVIEKGVLKEYKGNASIINVPDGVRTIGANVFHESSYICKPGYFVEVHLPKSVKKIGFRAFWHTYELEKITGAENVTEIGKQAFSDSGIREINFANVIKIGDEAFSDLWLDKVKLPNVEVIGKDAFYDSDIEEELSGLGKLKKIDSDIFWGCYLNEKVKNQYRVVQKLPNGKENAFLIANGIIFHVENYGCSGNLIIPDSVTDIAVSIYGSIISVTIPDSVVRITDYAFDTNFKLRWVKMADSVEEIGKGTFAYCRNLTDIRLSDSIRELNETFHHCSQLKSITLPAAIEKISRNALPEGITSIICPSGMTNIDFRAANDPEGSFLDTLMDGQGTFYVPEVDENSLLAGYARELGWDYLPIELEATEITVKVGEKYPLRFKGNAKAIWKTSNKKVATVGGTGDIYAKKAGRVTITATIYGREYTCEVTVVE